MSRRFIIHTAILLCSAFVFRLLFIHVGIVSSSESREKDHIQAYASLLSKKEIHFQASNYRGNNEFSLAENFEEDFDKHKFKPKVDFLGTILYTLVGSEIECDHSQTAVLYEPLSCASPPLYLSIQVFRI